MNTTKQKLAVLFVCLVSSLQLFAGEVITSPDGTIRVQFNTSKGQLGYTVSKNGQVVYTLSDISLNLGKETLPKGNVSVGKPRRVKNSFLPVVPLKFSTIYENYNEVSVSLGSNCQMQLRVMNNCVAYRFVLSRKGTVDVYDDHFRLTPASGFTAHYQTAPENFNTSYEERYRTSTIAEWVARPRFPSCSRARTTRSCSSARAMSTTIRISS